MAWGLGETQEAGSQHFCSVTLVESFLLCIFVSLSGKWSYSLPGHHHWALQYPREAGSRCPHLALYHPLPPQHVVFAISHVLDLLVPDIPESVEVKVKREYYLAKQALAENEVSPCPSPHTSFSLTRGGVAPSLVLCCSGDSVKKSV